MSTLSLFIFCNFKMMDEKIIGKIIEEVFQKAKKENASHSKFALSTHISNETNLSSRTLERAYDRYIDKKEKYGRPNADSINLFCAYLGYEDYGGYLANNSWYKTVSIQPKGKSVRGKVIITTSIFFGLTMLVLGFQNWPLNTLKNNPNVAECMTWADSLYVTVSCDKGPFSKHRTKVEPLIETKLKNMRKVKVDISYEFFSDTDEPLIWYYKKSSTEIEYFTAPGLHPKNGETLKKITPYIIQTYVPKHKNKKSSFVP